MCFVVGACCRPVGPWVLFDSGDEENLLAEMDGRRLWPPVRKEFQA